MSRKSVKRWNKTALRRGEVQRLSDAAAGRGRRNPGALVPCLAERPGTDAFDPERLAAEVAWLRAAGRRAACG